MADLTLYTMADPEILAGALNGVAMVFDPSNTNVWVSDPSASSGFGMGAIAGVGLVITLLIILFKGLLTQKLELGTFFIVIIAYTIAFVPKTTLQVERIQDGQIEIVDGLPYAVAIPAALMSGMMMAVTETFEVAFSDPRMGTYSETGFMDPLKTLVRMRDITAGAGNSVMKQNLQEFLRYCTVHPGTGAESNFEQDLKRHGGWAAIFDPNKLQPGLVELMVPSVGGSGGYNRAFFSCKHSIGSHQSAADFLRNEITTYIGSESPTGVNNNGLEADLVKKGGRSEIVPGEKATDRLRNSITTLVGNSTISANVAMSDLVVGSLLREVGTDYLFIDPDTMMATLSKTEAMERLTVDSAGSGSMFLSTMQYSMDIMLFVWIALSPVLAMTMIISGLAGIKMMSQYFLFGVWTQSWMPFAMVINYYMQLKISKTLETKLLTGGSLGDIFAPGMQVDLYRELAGTITAGSTLLAYTPILSLAVLSGSYFALSQLGSALGGKDGYFDEKKMAPDAGQGTGGTQAASYATQNMSATQMANLAATRSGAMTGSELAQGMTIGSSAQAVTADAVRLSNERAVAATQEAARQSAIEYGAGLSTNAQTAMQRTKGTSYGKALEEAGNVVDSWAKKNGLNLSEEERNALKVAVAAGLHYDGKNGGNDGDKAGGGEVTKGVLGKLMEQAEKTPGLGGLVAKLNKGTSVRGSITGGKESSEGQSLVDSLVTETSNQAQRSTKQSGSKQERDDLAKQDSNSSAYKEDSGFRNMVNAGQRFQETRTQKEAAEKTAQGTKSAQVGGPGLNTAQMGMLINANHGANAVGTTLSAGSSQAVAVGAMAGPDGDAQSQRFQEELAAAAQSGGVVGMLNKAAQWATNGANPVGQAIGFAALGGMMKASGSGNLSTEGDSFIQTAGNIAVREGTIARISEGNAGLDGQVGGAIAGNEAAVSAGAGAIQGQGAELKGTVGAATDRSTHAREGGKLFAEGAANADTYRGKGAAIVGGATSRINQLAAGEDGVHSGDLMNRLRGTLSQADEAVSAGGDALQGGYYAGKEAVLGALSSANANDAAGRSAELSKLKQLKGAIDEQGGWNNLSPEEQSNARKVMSSAGAGDYRMQNGQMLQDEALLDAAIEGKSNHIKGAMQVEQDYFAGALEAGQMSKEEFANASEKLADATSAFLDPEKFLSEQGERKQGELRGRTNRE